MKTGNIKEVTSQILCYQSWQKVIE